MTGTLQVNPASFTAPGTYLYKVAMDQDETSDLYAGVDYSQQSYTVKVFISMDKDTDQLYVDGYAVYDNQTGSKTDSVTFENTYTDMPVSITKVVSGDQADYEKAFDFTAALQGTAGKTYNLVQDGQVTQTIKADGSKQVVSFSLKNGQTAEIRGRTGSDTYVISEPGANQDHYQTTIAETSRSAVVDEAKGTVTGTGDSTNDITNTNTYNVSVPTGIFLNIWPMAALASAAAALLLAGVGFKRRKRM